MTGRWNFYSVMTALFVLALVLYGVAFVALEQSEVARNLLASVADALLVAVVLSVTVNRYVKVSLASEVARDVLSYAVGFEVPKEIQQEIKSMLQMPFIRHDFYLVLKLELLDPEHNYVRMITRLSYAVENLSDRPRRYEFKCRMENSRFPDKGNSEIRAMGVTKVGDKRSEFSLKEAQLDQLVERGAMFVEYETTVTISAHSQTWPEFWTERSTIMRSADTYILDFLESTLGVRVQADVPDEFDVMFLSRYGRMLNVFPPDRPRRWEDEAVYLPAQHVRIAWAYREPVVGKQVQSAAVEPAAESG